MKVAAIIMASGQSMRMGKDKLLMPLHGKPLYQHILETLQDLPLDPKLLVSRFKEVLDHASDFDCLPIENEKYYLGQSESVKLGVNYAEDVDGYLFVVCDQPFISKGTILQMMDEFEKHPNSIIVPLYAGQKASPVLFPSSLREQFLELQGDVNGNIILRRYPDLIRNIWIDNAIEGIDIDTLEDYKRYCE